MKIIEVVRNGAFAGIMVLLASCQQPADEKAEPEAAESAAPETKDGLSLSDAKLMLPVVDGRPGAVYFTFSNASDEPVTIAGAWVDGAEKAEIHETRGGTMAAIETLEVSPGDTVKFERGGLHVMAFGLSDSVSEGSSSEITLTFSDGDKISAPVSIEKMGSGDGMADMSGMGHGDGH